MKTLGVMPMHTSEGRKLEVFDRFPRTGPCGAADELGLVLPVDGLGEGVVVAVADGPDRWCRSALREAFVVANRRELTARIAVTAEIGVVGSASQRAISIASSTISVRI